MDQNGCRRGQNGACMDQNGAVQVNILKVFGQLLFHTLHIYIFMYHHFLSFPVDPEVQCHPLLLFVLSFLEHRCHPYFLFLQPLLSCQDHPASLELL